ncbi:Photosystem I chlorophyll a apoprotein A2 [Capsicum annuum]|nr:Photosystem I chlorophyll a apoprotein A2 [Capsicum annuum]
MLLSDAKTASDNSLGYDPLRDVMSRDEDSLSWQIIDNENGFEMPLVAMVLILNGTWESNGYLEWLGGGLWLMVGLRYPLRLVPDSARDTYLKTSLRCAQLLKIQKLEINRLGEWRLENRTFFSLWISSRLGSVVRKLKPAISTSVRARLLIWRVSGITSELQLYCTTIGALVLAALMLFAGWFHYHKAAPKLSWFQDVESMLNHHLAGLLGLRSLSWAGHQLHVQNPLHVRPIAHAIWDPHFGQPVMEAFTRGGALGPVNIAYSGVYQWWYTIVLRTNQDLYIGSLFLLFLSAISLIAGLFGVSSLAWTGHLVHVAIPTSRGEYVRWNNFLDVLLHPQGLGPLYTGLALASLGVITSLVAQHKYSLLAYAFIAQDFTTQAALYTPHQYIIGFIMTGAFAHGAIFFIRDYNPEQNEDNVLARMLDNKEAIISHLSWASLFLGFHPLGLYVHYDVMLAFGTLEKQILTEPMFTQ